MALLTWLETVEAAFRNWNAIRDQATAQAYLLSMLGNKDRREKETAARQQKKIRKAKQTHPSAPPL